MDLLNDFYTTILFLLQGLGVTVSVTVIALAVGFVLGVLMAVLRVYGNRPLSALAAGYSVVVRAVPVVVTIFILYFVIAQVVDLSPFLAGSLALGFASGAYQSEIFRGALQSVAPGQMTAARAIGMSRMQAIRHIVLPQAVRLALPGWGNEATLVLKDSTLVFAVGVPEMLRRAQYVSSRTLEPFLAFGAAALLYLALTVLTSFVLGRVEQRYRMLT
jgi:polar amino acid transport system permease protein